MANEHSALQGNQTQKAPPIPHDRLVDAIKAFLANEPGIEETTENKEVFELINKYFNPALDISNNEVHYLYAKLKQHVNRAAVGMLAEDYIQDLEVSPFPEYSRFSFKRWYNAISPARANLYDNIFTAVNNSKLFTELCGGTRPPSRALRYVAAALADKDIDPLIASARLYALTDGSRTHAEASGLLGGRGF